MILRFLGLMVLATFGVLFSMYSGIAGCAGPGTDTTATTFPATCAEVQEAALDETGDRPENGTYTLYVGGDETQPWDAYCHDMSRAEPAEYLTVVEADNYSQMLNDLGVVAETTYRRYRIDPITLEINPLDTTFATNTFPAVEEFDPTFPTEDMEFIPAGWAEVQQLVAFDAERPAAEANVSLAETAFVFSEDILADSLATFFCQVDSVPAESPEILPEATTGTGAEVTSDLTSFHLTAFNNNSQSIYQSATREVADCDNLGTGATDYSAGTWPLTYVGL